MYSYHDEPVTSNGGGLDDHAMVDSLLLDDPNSQLVSAWGPTVPVSSNMTTRTGSNVNFDDPKIANLPRVLLMGPRRSGKTSIQVRYSHWGVPIV